MFDLDDPEQRNLGDYELIELIGRGGMGVVYRARQRSLDREVALKLLVDGDWAAPDFVERFRREARAAARMQHPNIVEVYEIGEREGLHYFSMRYVDGPNLAEQVARLGPMAPHRAAELVRCVAEAVDYAHRLGVLHLDLKPGNILLDASGEPLVADFGLARLMDENPPLLTGEVSGTPSYMAPEQALAQQHPVGRASDVYGIGAVLYELIVGSPPFVGRTVEETLQRVVRDEPEPAHLKRRGISRDLSAICSRCLEKDPTRRYPSARALAEDLGRFLKGTAVEARPISAGARLLRWIRREPVLAALSLSLVCSLVLAAGIATWKWRESEASLQLASDLLAAGSGERGQQQRARRVEQWI